VVSRLSHFDHAADVADGHALGGQLFGSAVLSLRMICSAVCQMRFMVESPAQPGHQKTLIKRLLKNLRRPRLAAALPKGNPVLIGFLHMRQKAGQVA